MTDKLDRELDDLLSEPTRRELRKIKSDAKTMRRVKRDSDLPKERKHHKGMFTKGDPRIASPAVRAKGQAAGRAAKLRRKKARARLAEIVREVGNERLDIDDETPKLIAIVRGIYDDALEGDLRAAELLFNRGWGRPPVAVTLNIENELTKRLDEVGLSWDELRNDPLAAALMQMMGITSETDGRVIENTATPTAAPQPPVLPSE